MPLSVSINASHQNADLGTRRSGYNGGPRAGFTFFEIAISLALATFCVLTVLALVPAVIKTQQQARFRILATAKAMELVELFGGKNSEERVADFETPEPWEGRPWCYSSTRWDMECRCSRWDLGIMPVPLDIAQRLDSDNDEIHTLLSQGAYLYYADPRAISALGGEFANPSPPSEASKVVFAVSGYAQHNAIPMFSYKSWPYRAAYPSPPMMSMFDLQKAFMPINPPVGNGWPTSGMFVPWHWTPDIMFASPIPSEGWTNGNPNAALPAAHDPLMDALNLQAYTFIYDQNAARSGSNFYNNLPAAANRITAMQPDQGNLQKAVFNFITDKFDNIITNPMGGLPISGLSAKAEFTTYFLAPGVSDFVTLGQQYDADFCALCQLAEPLPGEPYLSSQQPSGKARLRAEIALRVQCMRFMSFIMSTYYTFQNGVDAAPPDLTQLPIQPFSPDLLSIDRLRYYHDRCKMFGMRFAASFPYDWGAPRPATRNLMMDYPLFEYDMFSPPHTGTIVGDGRSAAMWCPISAQTITDIGMPVDFPGILHNGSFDNTGSPFVPFDGLFRTPQPPNIWGNASHFTLTKPFAPAERCRQLVFWSVDWQSYEDAETAPSAPLDASRCPMGGINAQSFSQPYANRLNGINNNGLDWLGCLFLRNPERQLNFTSSMAGVASGANISTNLETYNPQGDAGTSGYDVGVAGLPVLAGVYGADRNHNGVLDRGPIKKSTRLHASLIGRFNFYDPRLPLSMR